MNFCPLPSLSLPIHLPLAPAFSSLTPVIHSRSLSIRLSVLLISFCQCQCLCTGMSPSRVHVAVFLVPWRVPVRPVCVNDGPSCGNQTVLHSGILWILLSSEKSHFLHTVPVISVPEMSCYCERSSPTVEPTNSCLTLPPLSRVMASLLLCLSVARYLYICILPTFIILVSLPLSCFSYTLLFYYQSVFLSPSG